MLLVSPISWMRGPLYCVHLLQAGCRYAGIETEVLYTNLLYVNITGPMLHDAIAYEDSLFLGEHLFAGAAFGIPAMSRCLDKFSDPGWVPDHTWVNKTRQCFPKVPEPVTYFRDWFRNVDLEKLECLTKDWVLSTAQKIAQMGFRIVGCSTSFGGLVPSIALLNGIKQVAPNMVTILGGALCDADMAEGILSLKAGIDYVFSGESELTFPDFVKRVLAGQLPEGKIIYGKHIRDLDTIPLPDYREYFRQREKFFPGSKGFSNERSIMVPYETSRGCWYSKCTFCAMNGKNNLYREKSSTKIINELKVLAKRHRGNSIFMTDNIMPYSYFNSLIPELPKEIPSLNICYEIKSNLTLDQVLSLKKADVVDIRTGIESLSPSLLKRMGKGVTVRENIALLRYARSVNLNITWNLIFGVPGDQESEYTDMLQLLPLIRHLQPPVNMVSLRICRFSRYHTSPEAFGISNLIPAEFYKDILPSHTDFEKIAYYFTGDFSAQSHEKPGMITALWEEYQCWRKAWTAYEVLPIEMILPTLHITQKTEDVYVMEDTRGLPGRPERMVLDREQVSMLLIPRPQDSSADFQWALDAQLGFFLDSWFIPLATAEPGLFLKFEREYESGK